MCIRDSLLVAAHFVQGDNLYRGRIVEFRHRRVVESDMAVFTDAHEYNVDWRQMCIRDSRNPL